VDGVGHVHTGSCHKYRAWIDENGWHYETWCQIEKDVRLMRTDSPVRLATPYAS